MEYDSHVHSHIYTSWLLLIFINKCEGQPDSFSAALISNCVIDPFHSIVSLHR